MVSEMRVGPLLLTASLPLNSFRSEKKMKGFAICRVRVFVNLASFSRNGVLHFVTFQRVESIFEVHLQSIVLLDVSFYHRSIRQG